MNFKNLSLAILLSFSSVFVFAHEDHSATTIKSLHGGIVKKSASTFVEVIQEEGKVEFYISNHENKNIVSPKLEVTAFAEVKGKKIPLKLKATNNAFEVMTDLKKEKHFKLNVIIKIAEKEEKVVFPLEN
jgi:glutamate/tyrosine decarboxylase-like PLP-dependent enzyme